ncbi:hypothetical protein Bbelb_373240 [Branchiostoma belcheri]|nr:hypothetical protein Bbelb_373240 [Branchiostoma belcheri]
MILGRSVFCYDLKSGIVVRKDFAAGQIDFERGFLVTTVADKDTPASSARTPASPARTPASTARIPASSLQRASSSAHEYLRRVCQELPHACTERDSSSAHEYLRRACQELPHACTERDSSATSLRATNARCTEEYVSPRLVEEWTVPYYRGPSILQQGGVTRILPCSELSLRAARSPRNLFLCRREEALGRHDAGIRAQTRKPLFLCRREEALGRHDAGIRAQTRKLFAEMTQVYAQSTQVCAQATQVCAQTTQGVQRRATKFILGPSSRQLDKSRLACLGWLPLPYRREISDVVTFVKSRAKVYDTDIARLVNFSSRVPRSSRAHMLVPPRVKTSSYASSFLPRVITIWNKLDVETRALGANASSPTDAAAYKRKCRLSMRNRFDQHFSVDIPCSWVMSCGCTSCRATRPR